MKWLFAFFFIPLNLFAAVGDITAGSVRVDGETIDIYVEGFSTNLAVNPNFATNNTPTANSKGYLLVNSPGFDQDVNEVTVLREVWLTGGIRIAAVTNLDATTTGSGVSIRVGLSEPLWTNCSPVSLVLGDGFLTDNGTNSAAITLSSIALTNLSQLPYPDPIGKPTEPGCRLMTNGFLRTVGFCHWSDLGQPLAAVWNIITGVTSGHSVTSKVSRMTILRDRVHGLPAAEFITEADLTGFTDNERLRIDTRLVPRIGKTNNIVDTRNNVNTWPSSRLCAFTNIVDLDLDYCDTAAIVSTNGVDATGQVFSKSVDPTTITNHFLTIAGAFTALQGTNGATTGQTNIGDSWIYLRTGITNFMGGTYTPNTTTPSRVFPWIKNYPGDTPVITTRLTSNDPGDLLGFDGVSFAIASAQVPFNAFNVLWIRNSPSFVCASTDPDVNVVQVWFDDCVVGSHSAGFKATTAGSVGGYFIRNCNLDGYNSQTVPVLFMGNSRYGTNGGTTISIVSDRAGQTGTPYEETIWYNNIIEGNEAATEMITAASTTNFVTGMAMVQNIWVKTGNPSLGPLASLASSVTNDANNFIIAYNEFINARVADVASNNTWTNGHGSRQNWMFFGNVINGSAGWKLDTTAPVDADKFNLPSFGCNFQFNWYGEATTSEVAGNSFPPDFAGLFSYHPPNGGNFTNLITAASWLDYPELTTGGNGNYRKQLLSPLNRMNPAGYRWPRRYLPYDVFGHPRSRFGLPGAVAIANTRRSFSE